MAKVIGVILCKVHVDRGRDDSIVPSIPPVAPVVRCRRLTSSIMPLNRRTFHHLGVRFFDLVVLVREMT